MSDDMKTQLSKAFNIPLQKDNEKGKKDYLKQEKKGNPKPQEKHGGKDMPPNRYLPLYDKLKQEGTTPRKMADSAHTGLIFDKFCDHWSGQTKWKEQIDTQRKQDIPKATLSDPSWNVNPKTWFLNTVAKHHNDHKVTDGLLKSYHSRRDALLAALKGKSYPFKTSWRFVSGLGMGHVLETGFVWHRILGVPYLPGSSVKGLIRAWADPKTDKETGEHLGWGDPDAWEEMKRLFGDEKDMGAGSLIVFDALPVEKPKLEVDIMNPHYGDYYSKKKLKIKLANGREQVIDTPPADYLSPNPIFFLTVAADVSFKFALAPRPGIGNSTDLSNGYKLLKEALENIGAGAKTAVGYGYFKGERDEAEKRSI